MFVSLSSFTFFVISTSFAVAVDELHKPHKVRHKHNLMKFHVDDIREALVSYRNAIPHLKNSENSEIDDLNDNYFDSVDNNLEIDKQSAFHSTTESSKIHRKFHHPPAYITKQNYQQTAPTKSETHQRNKRIQQPTTTRRTAPQKHKNYEIDYDDRELNDDANSGRFYREVSKLNLN